MKVKILHKQKECESYFNHLYSSSLLNPIIGNKELKCLLNNHFSPDEYAFFVADEDFLPLVVKKGVAYFFGGNLPFNDYNSLTSNQTLLNEAIEWLITKGYKFKLTNIENDPYDTLRKNNLKYDVPYNQEWQLKNLLNFEQDLWLQDLPRKRRTKMKKILKNRDVYSFDKINLKDFKLTWENYAYEKMIDAFEQRSKENIWKLYPDLYCDINNLLLKQNDFSITLMKNNQEIVGYYLLLLGKTMSHLLYCNSFAPKDDSITTLLYLRSYEDSLQYAVHHQLKNYSYSAGRGKFSYKSRMGLAPTPMYALVDCPSWSAKLNSDLSPSETLELYGRPFGATL